MTTPKKKTYRSLTVAGRRFKWRFNGHVVVVPAGVSGRRVLEVRFGWYDVWLFANRADGRPPPPARWVATPGFVARAVTFALTNGWNTEVRGGRLSIEATADGDFRVMPVGPAKTPAVAAPTDEELPPAIEGVNAGVLR